QNSRIKQGITVLSDLPGKKPRKVNVDNLVKDVRVLADASKQGPIAIAMGAHSRHVLAWLTKLSPSEYDYANISIVSHSNWNELDGRKGYEENKKPEDPPLQDTHGSDLRRGLYPNLAKISDLGVMILEIPRTDSGPGGWGGSVSKPDGGTAGIKALDISDLGLVHYLKTGVVEATRQQRNQFVSESQRKPANLKEVKPKLITDYWIKNRQVPGIKKDYLPSGKYNLRPKGELLYNGIRLPAEWPPKNFNFGKNRPIPPYLKNIPEVIPIDVGRQLLVDDFLIESTTLERTFHKPEKFPGNPILKPETPLELNQGINPAAVPFSDGAFYDPQDKLFKLWYQAGWFDGVALATSDDGMNWRRPNLDVVPGSNRVVAQHKELRRDGVSVWLDYDADKLDERYKMFYYARTGKLGGELQDGSGYLLTSPDGIHWNWRGQTGECGDNTTFFYNPFRKVWVYSVRKGVKLNGRKGKVRTRFYWENEDFLAAADGWEDYEPVFWDKADELDLQHLDIKEPTQLYKIDAVPYESLMIGIHQILLGPTNKVCAETGRAKLTDLKISFSRDGFHWDRSNRDSFLSASEIEGDWERAYITPTGGICNVVGDKLFFYYGAFKGDGSNRNPNNSWNGMYSDASTGLATLRRDGFASMDASNEEGVLTTRRLKFNGKYLFINADCQDGLLTAEILDAKGNRIAPFTRENCVPFKSDGTTVAIAWKDGADLSGLAGQPIQFRFYLRNGSLYSFWVSPNESGASRGYVAAGGPEFHGPRDGNFSQN
ncbi:MAG: hypothetical protein AAF483_30135, partial [Planctomycetota bacterium]